MQPRRLNQFVCVRYFLYFATTLYFHFLVLCNLWLRNPVSC